MFPWQLEKCLQQSAQWILTKDYENIYMNYIVLTDQNKDDNPIFSVSDAAEIFHALQKRTLIIPSIEYISLPNNQRRPISAFRFNKDKLSEWEKLSKKSGFISLILTPTIKYMLGKYPWIGALLLFVLTSFFAQFLSNLADDIYSWVKTSLNKPKIVSQQSDKSDRQDIEKTTEKDTSNKSNKKLE